MTHALIVEDDVDSAATLKTLVASQGFTVSTAFNLAEARKQLVLQPPDIVLLDLRLPDGSGMDLFNDPELLSNSEVVLITGYASLDTSILALRLGVVDYIVKPINLTHLQGVLSRVTKPALLKAEVEDLTAKLAVKGHFGQLWGRAPSMKRVYEQISRVAGTGLTVLITGESGTGKEVVAQTIHELSRRRKMPFLGVNCGAISPHLIESEIFGHEKGSFTGADRQHQGFFERASGGTLFLDEITEMPLELQVKLLRVLETGRFMRVGATQSQEVDVRIVAATNRSPQHAVDSGRLREDLLYRLNVFPIELPPLRDRLSDVDLLAEHFLRQISEQEGKVKVFTPDALEQLTRYHWPGNVRELRNAVHRAYVMAPGAQIDAQWLPRSGEKADEPARACAPVSAPATAEPVPVHAPQVAPAAQHPEGGSVVIPVGTTLAEAEQTLILATLRHYRHQKERTAATLGISLKTLYNRLKKYSADGDHDG
ncbi:MAG: sigma-54-dependent Fis family transcriptional regulator [Burkholderiales bacterium RIFCSPLOWO2_12_67_14]|nr:MAG: sigma-54-dependent Fis family transcriptional regulator [Burkholderiales bacterium RIFCSPLOWO2_02_FULL_67_64]OGB44469.1 MAG: sigma-54-dependent Fis family transcriptional regulator [Burkholderiales bacterium RIFCSPHIGHO2_12_FULL_67_38]OGB50513.1 MAG: sigma-54-dependent Fis family transcriptional regulator [Burkholderiales bacterium RIFCSPLOWO2_12_67_14]